MIDGLSDEQNAMFEAAFAAQKKKMITDAFYDVDEDEYIAISDEPVKAKEGAIQNSGIEIGRDKTVLVPHLTVDETNRNTPANGKGMVPIKAPHGTGTETFYKLLSNAYALYVTTGSYDNEGLQRRTGMTEASIAKVIASPEFKRAMSVRGVVPNASGLTLEQDYALQKLTDPSDGKNLQAKLKQLGVSYSKYRAWMKQPVFKAVIESYTNDVLYDNNPSMVQLAKKAGEGDLAAIKYLHELNGTYDPNRQTNIDFMQMLQLVIEIIFRHVKDADTLKALDSDLKMVVEKMTGPKRLGN